MLWSSDSPSTSEAATTPTVETEENPLERTDSIETAILAPEDLEGEGPVPPAITPEPKEEDIEEEAVPKDEIELLEEEGVLAPLPTSSPMPASSSDVKPDTDSPTELPTKGAEAEKAEKVEEIEKGIENLEEIKDEEQVIQPAVVDLLGSTPVLDTPESEDSTGSQIETDSTKAEAPAKEEDTSAPPEKESKTDEADTIGTTDKVSPSYETANESTTEIVPTTKKDSRTKSTKKD